MRGAWETVCFILLRASDALEPLAELQGVSALGRTRAAAVGSCTSSCAEVEEAVLHSL